MSDELPDGHWIKTARETGQRIKKVLGGYEEDRINGVPGPDPFSELEDDKSEGPNNPGG
jgi:hypothetical protein